MGNRYSSRVNKSMSSGMSYLFTASGQTAHSPSAGWETLRFSWYKLSVLLMFVHSRPFITLKPNVKKPFTSFLFMFRLKNLVSSPRFFLMLQWNAEYKAFQNATLWTIAGSSWAMSGDFIVKTPWTWRGSGLLIDKSKNSFFYLRFSYHASCLIIWTIWMSVFLV